MQLQHLSQGEKNDKELVLVAVSKDGQAIQFADPTLQADMEVVLKAIINDGLALEFADPTLKADKEVVLKAVMTNGCALKFADPAFQVDKEITLMAAMGDDNPLTKHFLQDAETELQSLQRTIRGEDKDIFNAVCCLIHPHRNHLSSQSVFANSTSSAIPSREETLSESTQDLAKRQENS